MINSYYNIIITESNDISLLNRIQFEKKIKIRYNYKKKNINFMLIAF